MKVGVKKFLFETGLRRSFRELEDIADRPRMNKLFPGRTAGWRASEAGERP